MLTGLQLVSSTDTAVATMHLQLEVERDLRLGLSWGGLKHVLIARALEERNDAVVCL